MQLTRQQGIALDNFINNYVNGLNNSDTINKNDIADIIREEVSLKMNSGMSLNEALSDLDVVNLQNRIVNIDEVNGKTTEKEDILNILSDEPRKKKSGALRFTLVSLFMIPFWILGSIFGFAAIVVAIVGLALFFSPVYGAFAFAIYDLGPALGIFFLILGAAPIIMYLLYWVFGALWEVVKMFINTSARMYNKDTNIPNTLHKINFLKAGMRANMKVISSLAIIFGLMFAGSAAGSIAPSNGVIGGAIRDGYVHEQTITLDLKEELAGKKFYQVTFENLWSHNDIDANKLFVADSNLKIIDGDTVRTDNLIQIKFKYNTKLDENKISYKVETTWNGENTQLRIRFDYHDIEPMMNLKGYGYEIHYSNENSAFSGANFEAFVINK